LEEAKISNHQGFVNVLGFLAYIIRKGKNWGTPDSESP
jgi:hypothetical protein